MGRDARLHPGEDGTREELLEPFDGLLLVGGGDIDPVRYGGDARDGRLYGVEHDRDELEIQLLLAADRMRLPALCICRGMQVMNVAFGGTLHPHLPDLPGMLEHGVPVLDTQSLHDVQVEHASRLFATTKVSTLAAASHHHQGVDRVGGGLLVSGRTSDGLVEAIERDHDLEVDLDRWMVGVQWHPEDTANDDPAQQALFDGLALLARVRGSKAEHHGVGRTRAYSIVEPDTAWAERFEQEAARLRVALGAQVVRIEHIGSTSVRGLPAKPIVDISVGLTSMEPRGAYLPVLHGLGYRTVLDPSDPDHEFASLDLDGQRCFHVHLCLAGSRFERRHLAFRDWLRTHPEDAAAYGELKRELAATHPNDVHTYTEAKTGFIRSIEAQVLAAASGAV